MRMTLDDLDTTVQELRLETSQGALTKKLAHVVSVLAAIPDLPPAEFSTDALIRLRELAAETIEAIETRIDTGGDGIDVQQHLAGTVYEIGRRMELVETWFKPFA